MKKLYSLIKASMTADMGLYKIKQNNKNKLLVPFILTILFMFAVWSNANLIFEKVAPLHLQIIVISLFVFGISIMTIIEGVYKSGPLIFNCKDDQILLSLPIKKSTVLFIRIFKFYIFELKFNTLFILPLIVAYLRWADSLKWTFFLTSFIMIIILPIIPIVISTIIGAIMTSIASRFKYKDLVQIIIGTIFILGIMTVSMFADSIFEYIAKHATSINDFITKLYYPAGVYAKLATDFKYSDLILFIIINVLLFVLSIIVLSKYYFRINSRIKHVTTTHKTSTKNLSYKANNKNISLVKKELNTFFKIPVFVINAGFALVLNLIIAISFAVKYDEIISEFQTFLPIDSINKMSSIVLLILILFTSYTTSITNSVISLEGRNINILKSLPVNTKTILLSKALAAFIITIPSLLVGDIILFIKFGISIYEVLLLLILTILIPLVSNFVGLIVNLKYPKLDAESTTEVVKQSTSSLISVMIGMLLLVLNILIISKAIEFISTTFILIIFVIGYIIIDSLLYLYLTNVSVKDFKKLSI